MKTIELGG